MATLFDFLPDATFAIDRDGTVIAWNRAMEEMTSIPAAEMVGKGDYEYALPFYNMRRPVLLNLLLEKDNELLKVFYSSIKRERDLIIAETELPHLKGKQMVVWAKAAPLYDDQGKVIGAIETIRDITEKKKLEHALEESNELFHLLLDHMLDATLIMDWDGAVLYASAAAAQLVDIEDVSLGLGLNILDFIKPEFRATIFRDIAKVREGRGGFLGDSQIVTKKGMEKWIQGLATRITFRGRLVALVTLRDITEQKQAEEGLRVSEGKFRGLFENAHDAIFLTGDDDKFLEVNGAAATLLNFSRDELQSLSLAAICSSRDRDRLTTILHQLKTEEHATFELHLLRKGDVEVPVEISSHTFILNGKHVILFIARDITERRVLRKREEEAFRQIEQNITKFNILNDKIRNPLAVIVALADMEGGPTMEKILFQAKDINRIITDLDMGWLQSEKIREFLRKHYDVTEI